MAGPGSERRGLTRNRGKGKEEVAYALDGKEQCVVTRGVGAPTGLECIRPAYVQASGRRGRTNVPLAVFYSRAREKGGNRGGGTGQRRMSAALRCWLTRRGRAAPSIGVVVVCGGAGEAAGIAGKKTMMCL
jgi:hypothetical protein